MREPLAKDRHYDIIIVGYGPTGATLANLLGKRGWRVAVTDMAAEIYDKPRAITADHEAFRIFQEIGIADEVFSTSTPHPGTDFVGLEGQVIKRFYPAPPPEPLGWTPSFMFVQPELEATLRRGVSKLANVDALLKHQYIECRQDAEGVEADFLSLSDGQTITLSAKYLIGADGASSKVRKQLMPAIEDLAFDEWWLVIDAWIRGPIELPERCVQYCRPSRPGTYIVGPGTLRRWEIKILPGESPQRFEDHSKVWRVLGEFADTRSLEHCRTAIYRFHALVVENWRNGRVFLAGDAAHQMPPFLGQGLCAGVRDAYNLAWKLDAVLHGHYADSLLDTYCQERKKHVRTVVGHAKDFGLIIGELDPDAARERDQRLGEELASGKAQTIRQKFIPGLEMGLIYKDHAHQPVPGAGELFVQPWVQSANSPWIRLDDVLGSRFAIVGDHNTAVFEQLPSEVARQWERLGGVFASISDDSQLSNAALASNGVLMERDGIFKNWLVSHKGLAAIVRPDKYVFAVIRSREELIEAISQLSTSLLVESDTETTTA